MKLYLSMVKKEGIIEFPKKKKKKNQNEISLPKSKQSLPKVGLLNLSLMIFLSDNACALHINLSISLMPLALRKVGRFESMWGSVSSVLGVAAVLSPICEKLFLTFFSIKSYTPLSTITKNNYNHITLMHISNFVCGRPHHSFGLIKW